MTRNGEYWKRRFALLEQSQLDKSELYVRTMEKVYEQARRSIDADISSWYARLSQNNGISLAESKKMLAGKELSEFKWTVDEYIEKGRTLNLSTQWQKQLENASARVHINRLDALKLQMQQHLEELYSREDKGINKLLQDIYEDGYYHTAYEIQKGFGIGSNLMRLDKNQIEKIVSKPWTVDGNTFSDRIWKAKSQLLSDLQTGLTQALARGDSPYVMTDYLAKKFDVSKKQAGRLIATESAFFASASTKDCFKELGVEQFEIVATLDNKTSEVCQGLDGQHFVMSDFEIGVTAPPFHPNCRCATVPYFNDEFTVGEQRAYRDEDGNTEYIDAKMKYPEWKKRFLKTEPEPVKLSSKVNARESGKPQQSDEFTHPKEKYMDKVFRHARFKTGDTNSEEYALSKKELSDFKPIPEKDAANVALKEFKPWVNSLNKTERKLINLYSHNENDSKPKFFERINTFIRNGFKGEKNYTEPVNIISNAIKRCELKHDYICYRGTDFNPFEGMNVGETRKVNQFFSSSVLPKGAFGGKYVIRIYAPKGTRAAYIEQVSAKKFQYQREMLFDYDLNYEFLGIKGRVITVKALP